MLTCRHFKRVGLILLCFCANLWSWLMYPSELLGEVAKLVCCTLQRCLDNLLLYVWCTTSLMMCFHVKLFCLLVKLVAGCLASLLLWPHAWPASWCKLCASVLAYHAGWCIFLGCYANLWSCLVHTSGLLDSLIMLVCSLFDTIRQVGCAHQLDKICKPPTRCINLHDK